MRKDFYSLLGLNRNATSDQIKVQFYRLALKYHPDQNHDQCSTNQYKDILEAYNTLKDPVKRSKYDAQSLKLPSISTQNYQVKNESKHWEEWAKWRYTEKDPITERPIKPKEETEEQERVKTRFIALFSGLIAYLLTIIIGEKKK